MKMMMTMTAKPSSVVSCLTALLACFLTMTGDVGAKPIESVEQVLNSAPASSLRKLQNKATVAAGQAELGKYFGTKIIDQPALIHAMIDLSEPTPEGLNKYRIRVTNVPVSVKGVTMNRLTWFYFPQANIPPRREVPVGAEITVSGKVRRCEIVSVNGALQINFDLVESRLERSSITARR